MNLCIITGKIGSGKSTILSSIKELGGSCYSMDEFSNIVLQTLLMDEVLSLCNGQILIIDDMVQVYQAYQLMIELWEQLSDKHPNDHFILQRYGRVVNLTKKFTALKELMQKKMPLPPIIDKKRLSTIILQKPSLLQQLEDVIYPTTLHLALHYIRKKLAIHRIIYIEHPPVKLNILLNNLKDISHHFFIVEIDEKLRNTRLLQRDTDRLLLKMLQERQDIELSTLLQHVDSHKITTLKHENSNLIAQKILAIT
ncbi:nucleoside/nucleotide kinase family protein [Candidatus Fokinia crypta]|uniref:Dephospho-CoA kinasefamily protein n=1 Tax=Candidatus Fokinia crypta TaxID=1920990 RepID=A0ABZ0UQ27_9RICK|nr:hypothetical protein [Candidatus Fokinia cryptica]WPX97777.1 Putative Dephospho-CoA kinasefamily protein [Candidatus Fokinia cryptica]